MLTLPLVTRELRVQSRRRGTYIARLGWGLAATGALALVLISDPQNLRSGQIFFGLIHAALAIMLFFMAPLGVADALSREKREGTLGLLLLTNITPFQVVLGKLAAHFFRLLYFVGMMLPFTMLPIMMGGVQWQDFLLSATMLIGIAIAGASGGLLASALCVRFTSALLWALIFSALANLLVGAVVANSVFNSVAPRIGGDVPLLVRIFVFGPALLLAPQQARQVIASITFPAPSLLWFEIGVPALACLALLLATAVAARKVTTHSKIPTETKQRAALRRAFLAPVFWRNRFRRSMRGKLDRNPLIWLEYRTTWARSARWMLLLLAIAFETWLLKELPHQRDFYELHLFAIIGLLTFLTFKTCGSFQTEKESVAFELLLVTPFTEAKLYKARLRAVASYFWPIVATLAIFGSWGFTWAQTHLYHTDFLPFLSPYFNSLLLSLLTIPITGLYFALRANTFLPALLWTAALAFAGPLGIWYAIDGLAWMLARRGLWLGHLLRQTIESGSALAILFVLAYHLTLAILTARAALTLLRTRRFTAQ